MIVTLTRSPLAAALRPARLVHCAAAASPPQLTHSPDRLCPRLRPSTPTHPLIHPPAAALHPAADMSSVPTASASLSSPLVAVQQRLNAHWSGAQPWQVCRDTVAAVAALYVAFKVARVVRRKGIRKAAVGAALGLINSTGKGREAVKAETQKTIKKLQEIVRRHSTQADQHANRLHRRSRSRQWAAVRTEL